MDLSNNFNLNRSYADLNSEFLNSNKFLIDLSVYSIDFKPVELYISFDWSNLTVRFILSKSVEALLLL